MASVQGRTKESCIMLALIPARGGSRRIPRKNVRPFLGVPAIARVIDTILAAEVAERIIVSTDDEEVAAIATEHGAEVPGLRPVALADDQTSTLAVVHHAIAAWMSHLEPSDGLLVAYPTAVLLTPGLLQDAAERFDREEAEFLIPVLRYPHPVERRLRIDRSGCLRPDEPQHLASRTQDLEPAYHDAGQFYLGRRSAWQEEASPLAEGRALAWELPGGCAVDIDEPADWDRAEELARLQGMLPS